MTSTFKKLNELIAERILILDGAMGSMIQAYRLPNGKPLEEDDFRGDRFANHDKPLKGCNDILCLSRPDLITGIHEAFLEAGADIIETCSFNATSISLKDFGLKTMAREISAASAALARKAADKFSSAEKPRFVAGSMGPTSKSASFTPDIDKPWERQISSEELEAAYYENALGLAEGGVDFFLVETLFDGLNARAALSAIKRLSKELSRDIPIMVSATVSEAGRLLTGQTIEAFCVSMLHAELSAAASTVPAATVSNETWALGLNCSFGTDLLKGPLERLSSYAFCPVVFYPNAGLPDAHGHYNDTPEMMALAAEACMKEGLVNIIGGCCGTTPAHIAEIAKKAKKYKPRPIPLPGTKTLLAGTQVLEIDDLDELLKAETAVIPWQSALDEGNFEDAIDIARDEAENGLKILVINTDKSPDPLKTMESFIFLAASFSSLAKLPILIESRSREVIERGLKCFQGRGLVRFIGPS